MRDYYRNIIRRKLAELFDDGDAETVLTWMISNDDRRPVLVVGAGFSLNALNKRSGLPVLRSEVPLWADIIERFASDTRLDTKRYDALTLAELYFEEMGPAKFSSVLLDMLRDDDLAPGAAHEALFDYPAEAVVTTNHLDTLLDKNDRNWVRVVQDGSRVLEGVG